MDFNKLSPLQVECILTFEELKERNIDITNSSYHNPNIRNLFNELKEKILLEYSINTIGKSLIIEAVPSTLGLAVVFTWIEGNSDAINPSFSTFYSSPNLSINKASNKEVTKPNDRTDATDHFSNLPPLSLDEIQNAILSDILTGIGNGNIRASLSKYLKDGFLDQLMNALPNDKLENTMNSILEDFATSNLNASDFTGEEGLNMNKSSDFNFKNTINNYIERLDSTTTSSNITNANKESNLSYNNNADSSYSVNSTDKSSISDKEDKNSANKEAASILFAASSIFELQELIDLYKLGESNIQSALIKDEEGDYLLILSSKDLEDPVFLDLIENIDFLPDAGLVSHKQVAFLKEHGDIIIAKNAIKHLK